MIADHLVFAGINILLAWSVYVALQAGSLSFAQGAFMAVGCYTAGLLTTRLGMPLLAACVIAAAATSALAALLGYPALRLRGIYLILVTIGITFCVRVLLENLAFTGGIGGFSGMSGANVYGVGAAVLVVGAFLAWLSASPLQRVLDAVREDERVAASLGIDVTQIRLVAFATGAGIAALAGALYGHYMSFVRPDNFDVLQSIFPVLYVIFGGANNFVGPALGALIMTLLPEYFRGLAEWRPTVFGATLLLVLLFRPDGLLPLRRSTASARQGA